MKIDKRIRGAYAEQYAQNEVLKAHADTIRRLLDPGWHYESRLKPAESFALKIEAGRYTGDLIIDDFLGCLIVVRSASELSKAVELVKSMFAVQYQRPESGETATRSAADFTFDDLRMYVRTKTPEYLASRDFDKIIFEVQIKTFLQHAWGVATHDLTYKTGVVNWAKARIAYQVRAMLEHAELSIEQVNQLSESAIVAKEFRDFSELREIIDFLKRHWTAERLPQDLQRLASNARAALRAFNVTVLQLDRMLEEETAEGRGAKLENLSPYGTILHALVHRVPEVIAAAKAPKRRIPMSQEIELPEALEHVANRLFHRF